MIHYEEEILRSLRRITRAIDLYSRQLASKHGLTGPQLVCLRTLLRLGPVTPSVLSREMDLSQATVTGILDRLAAQGLLGRTRHAEDRRRVIVDLTEAGRNVLRSAPSPLQDIFSGRLASLSVEERAAIHDSLERIVEMMRAEAIDPEAPLAAEEPLSGVVVEDVLPMSEPVGAGAPLPREEDAS